ncbi:uncharacterized protein K489DRAFT_234055 [Dissoconium aciculare CBS 342.82]|uniref:Uncharacterized protein n=1 Tax=Dissoconium aciculare CBS 342.82 TaxID=1314786 RepID=A0A6J3M5N1_9PEZI|nr:uncharacterized protein K489DRAFT_234055 [Dissoconium aciculare CBS 342.82]KAF1822147.1 hypothetical protein K489DRAFT_234055 [Dissoconium aciculare CBS 342.82]
MKQLTVPAKGDATVCRGGATGSLAVRRSPLGVLDRSGDAGESDRRRGGGLGRRRRRDRGNTCSSSLSSRYANGPAARATASLGGRAAASAASPEPLRPAPRLTRDWASLYGAGLGKRSGRFFKCAGRSRNSSSLSRNESTLATDDATLLLGGEMGLGLVTGSGLTVLVLVRRRLSSLSSSNPVAQGSRPLRRPVSARKPLNCFWRAYVAMSQKEGVVPRRQGLLLAKREADRTG